MTPSHGPNDLTLIPGDDRGVNYGDGVFETLRVADGAVLHWPLHRRRLQWGLERLKIALTDWATLESDLAQAASEHQAAVLKLIVTRGSGPRGYRPPQVVHPRWFLQVGPMPDYDPDWAEKGVAVRVCETRLAHQPLLAGIKHLNRLEQVMARSEWQDEFQEGLMLDQEDRVICGTMSNVFMVQGNQLLTPQLDHCGIAGITRQRLMAASGLLGFACEERPLSLADLADAEGLFLTNTVFGLWPVRQLQDQQFGISDGVRRLQRLLQRMAAKRR